MEVLVVEDDQTLAEIIRRNLEAHGLTATVADTAEAALDQVRRRRPSALVLDVNLPDASGWEVLRRLAVDGLATPPVIVISAAPISEKRIAELRPARVLQKPFSMTTLLHAIDEACTEQMEEPEASL